MSHPTVATALITAIQAGCSSGPSAIPMKTCNQMKPAKATARVGMTPGAHHAATQAPTRAVEIIASGQ